MYNIKLFWQKKLKYINTIIIYLGIGINIYHRFLNLIFSFQKIDVFIQNNGQYRHFTYLRIKYNKKM